MSYTGGDSESLSLDGQEFAIASGVDIELMTGGKEAEVESNGDGSVRTLITNKPWSLGNVEVACDIKANHLEYVKSIVGRQVAVRVTLPDSTDYKGTGTVTGEVKYNAAKGTMSFGLKGGQTLTRQS